MRSVLFLQRHVDCQQGTRNQVTAWPTRVSERGCWGAYGTSSHPPSVLFAEDDKVWLHASVFFFFLNSSTKGYSYPNKYCSLVTFQVGSYPKLVTLLKPVLESPSRLTFISSVTQELVAQAFFCLPLSFPLLHPLPSFLFFLPLVFFNKPKLSLIYQILCWMIF